MLYVLGQSTAFNTYIAISCGPSSKTEGPPRQTDSQTAHFFDEAKRDELHGWLFYPSIFFLQALLGSLALAARGLVQEPPARLEAGRSGTVWVSTELQPCYQRDWTA